MTGIGYNAMIAFFIFLLVFPFLAKLKIFKSHRDPYFWRRVLEEGSPAWITRRLITTLVIALMAANAFTPIFQAFYIEIFGIGRGSFLQIGDRLSQTISGYYYDIPHTIYMINPLNWVKQMSILPMAWLPTFVLFLGAGVYYLYQRYANMRNRQQDEYGGATFTEPFEVKQQYLAVPDRGKTFDGYGGVPVSHRFNLNGEGIGLYLATIRPKTIPSQFLKYSSSALGNPNPIHVPGLYYLDNKAVNTIILGDTRSGKGETVVLATIDLIARGKEDQSIVVGDMKGELATKTTDLLRRHNYDVKIVNFDNLNYSMPINFLNQAIFFAKRGNYPRARTKISQLTNTIFPSEDNDFKNRFWTNGSSATYTGLILATMWFMSKENRWDKVTVGNVTEMLERLGTQEETVDVNGNRLTRTPGPNDKTKQMSKLDLLIDAMKARMQSDQESGKPQDALLQMAISAFNQAGMGGNETKRNIYSSMFSDVELFTSDISVRKLTTIGDFRYSSVGFPRVMELQLPVYFQNRKVLIDFDANGKHYSEIVIADEMGLVQFAIEPKLDEYTTFLVHFDDPENKNHEEALNGTTIFDKTITIEARKKYERVGLKQKKLDPYSGLPIINGYELSEMTTDITLGNTEVSFDYSEKRTAIFVVLPPLNAQYNQLAMFFMEQLYQENYDWANRNKNYNINRIHFLLDEFGNFPKWSGLSTKLSAALGYNFAFTMILQNMEQLTDVYGEHTAGTIRANSSNFGYIKTSSQATAEQISKWLGDRTITYSTPGSDQSNSDSRSRSMKEQPLLSPVQLMRFRPSQMLFFRAAKNDDLKGHQVDTNPIYNYGWTAMPFAFNLLKGYINDTPELSKIQVDSPQRYLNLDKYAIDFYALLDGIYAENDPAYAQVMKNRADKDAKDKANQIEAFESSKDNYLTDVESNDSKLVQQLSEAIVPLLEKVAAVNPEKAKAHDLDTLIKLAQSGKFPFVGDYVTRKALITLIGGTQIHALDVVKKKYSTA